jgi:hypothetical protein
MKKLIPLFLFLAGLNAHATAYTYCEDGTLYQCGGGDACNPEPCYAIGDCSKDNVRAAELAGFSVDLQPEKSRIVQSLLVNVNSCL